MVDLSAAYRAVWRWHFYAGLIVLPVLCLLALTGGLYLFKPEIEAALYGGLRAVPAVAEAAPPGLWVQSAEAALDGRVSAVRLPERPDRAVELTVQTDDGARTAFVDPATGLVQGSISGAGAMDVVRQLHSLELFGRPFNILVEIVAGWAIILVATGVFLWWPRRRDVAVAVPRAGDPARRPFWRDLHAVTGLYAGGVVAFLAVTGMPWSAVWGDVFLSQMRASGLGRPAAPSIETPWRAATGADAPQGTGWTLESATLAVPDDPHAEHAGHGAQPTAGGASDSAAVTRVVAAAEAAHLPRPYLVNIPSDPTRAFTVARETVAAEEARTLYVAPSGRILADYAWADFGVGAQAFEWGVAVHQGLQYGGWNRLLMLGGCIAIWLLAVSGTIMWWKRRPKGRLGAPIAPPGPRARAAVLGIVLPLAVLYPLTGLSLLAAIAVERLIGWIRRRYPAGRRPRVPG